VVHCNGFVCQNAPVHACDLGAYPAASIRLKGGDSFDARGLELTDEKNKVQGKKHCEAEHAMRTTEDN
jgi:hypothetical protein